MTKHASRSVATWTDPFRAGAVLAGPSDFIPRDQCRWTNCGTSDRAAWDSCGWYSGYGPSSVFDEPGTCTGGCPDYMVKVTVSEFGQSFCPIGEWQAYCCYARYKTPARNSQEKEDRLKELLGMWAADPVCPADNGQILHTRSTPTLSGNVSVVRRGEREFEGFRVYGQGALDRSDFTGTCKTALSALVKCDDLARTFRTPSYHGVLPNTDISDSVCDPGCARSLQNWMTAVEALCDGQLWENGAPAEIIGGYIQYGVQETCQKQQGTDKYCNGKCKVRDPMTGKSMPK